MASAAEREMRDDVAEWWRQRTPDARICHEVPLSSMSSDGRADLAVVAPDRLVLIELKSSRDKLSRLAPQMEAMRLRACRTVAVVDQKHFGEDKWGSPSLKNYDGPYFGHRLWQWPRPEDPPRYERTWTLDPRSAPSPPNVGIALHMLWAEELRRLGQYHGFGFTTRANRPEMIAALADGLTGAEARRGICAALRTRVFSEADPAREWAPGPSRWRNAA